MLNFVFYCRVLHLAVIYDQVDVLGSILDVVGTLENRYEILNCVNNDRQTAMQIAALTDNVEAVIVSEISPRFCKTTTDVVLHRLFIAGIGLVGSV